MAPQYCVWFGDGLPCLPGEQSPCRDPDRPDGGSDVTPAGALRPGASSARWVPARRRGRRLVECRRQIIVAIRGILLSLMLGISTRMYSQHLWITRFNCTLNCFILFIICLQLQLVTKVNPGGISDIFRETRRHAIDNYELEEFRWRAVSFPGKGK